jgi:bifunctional UDP-N-acetylglucosamine pyrophosphorylase / glucosamine-1-phosphate N-acetyltransferase
VNQAVPHQSPSTQSPSTQRPDTHLTSIVLAAGEGTRMHSARPKPLHLLCGRAMLLHVLDRLADIGAGQAVVVVGYDGDRVADKVRADGPPGLPIEVVEQVIRAGTGDAAKVGLQAVPDDEDDLDVLIAHGDQPLVRASTLRQLVDRHRESGAAATVLTVRLPDPSGYGRVVRNRDGGVARIVEERDASLEERTIDETNTGFYCFKRSLLAPALRRIRPDNHAGELYLTDVIKVLSTAGHPVEAVEAADPGEMLGVNDRLQLAAAEGELRRRTNAAWMARGVTMLDPASVSIDSSVELGTDVTLFPGTILQGATSVGEGTELGPDTHLIDVVVGRGCRVRATTAEGSTIGDGADVGPYAYVGKGGEIPPGAVTGPFYTPA